jgi:hypothetical protein
MEGVGLAVGRDIPAFGEARLDLGAAALELDEAVVDGERVGREVSARGVLGWVKTRRAAFLAVDQGFIRDLGTRDIGAHHRYRCSGDERGNPRGAQQVVLLHVSSRFGAGLHQRSAILLEHAVRQQAEEIPCAQKRKHLLSKD